MRYLAAVLALSIIAVTASAQERRPFPVATAVGKGINRVVGFPFRVAAAAVGIDPQRRAAVRVQTQNVRVEVNQPRRGIVRVDAPRVQVRVNQPVVRQVRVQRIGAAYDVQQIRVQRIGAAYHHNDVQQVRVIRQPVVVTERQNYTYSAAAGATSQIYSDPVITQRVEVEEPPTVLQEVAKPTVQRVIIQRVTSGHCGPASGFRY